MRIREGMQEGRWRETLPGRSRMAKQLGVSEQTIEQAMRQLARSGWLISQGPGKRRRILLPKGVSATRKIRVRILLYDPVDASLPYNMALMEKLGRSGYAVEYATKTIADLGKQARRVQRFVEKTPADAWVIQAGPREVLKWFADCGVPAIAMFGSCLGLDLAASSAQKATALKTAIERLIALGHQRIVMLTREERRKPKPALFEQVFLDELSRHGVKTGPYHLPDWPERRCDLQAFIDSLFRYTPPTALIIEESPFFLAARQHLADKGISAPRDISMICADSDPSLAYFEPMVSHMRWDYQRVVQRVVRWVNHIANGKNDRRQSLFDAEFVEGGTIGPAP